MKTVLVLVHFVPLLVGNLDLGGNLLSIDLGHGCPMAAILGQVAWRGKRTWLRFAKLAEITGIFWRNKSDKSYSFWVIDLSWSQRHQSKKPYFFSCITDMKSASVWDKNQSKGQWFYLGLDGCYQLRTLRKFLHPSNRDGKDEDTQWFNALVLRKMTFFFLKFGSLSDRPKRWIFL